MKPCLEILVFPEESIDDFKIPEHDIGRLAFDWTIEKFNEEDGLVIQLVFEEPLLIS